MIVPCEVAVKFVVPAVKALVATRLVDKHGLKQDEVAEILGISQSAVSRYTRKNRGHNINIGGAGDIEPLINKMATLVLNGSSQKHTFLTSFCQACVIVRKNSLMCPFCRSTNHKAEMEDCDVCLT